MTRSRTMPFAVAMVVCFGAAVALGGGGWYLFGTDRHLSTEKNVPAVQTSNRETGITSNTVDNSNIAPPTAPIAEVRKAPAGEIHVDGGEITLGGLDTKIPLKRVAVEAFSIGETEVTNAQYSEFIKETSHKAPANWTNGEFPAERANEPVVGVTWADANGYCEWLSKKIGTTVRLPSEAEWEMAARGNTGFKYPWGNQWLENMSGSSETDGKVLPVKSFPKGVSPFGVFDMVGNVWEWTSDVFGDEAGNPVLYEDGKQRVIKGGSAREKREYLTIRGRAPRPEDRPKDLLGFRYVIIRK